MIGSASFCAAPFGLPAIAITCNTIEVVIRVFAGAGDQKIFFLVHQVLTFELGHLEIRGQLDRGGRAGFLAETAENAAREVDPEEVRVPATVFGFSFLQRDATHRAGHGAQVAGYAAFFAIGVAGQDDAATVTRRQIDLLLGVLQGVALAKAMAEDHDQAAQLGTGTLNDVANIFEHGSNPH